MPYDAADLLSGLEDIRVTSIQHAHAADAEVLAACGSQISVVTRVVMYLALGQEGIVLDLRLAQGRGVVRDDHKLGLGGAEGLDAGLVTQGSLSGGHHQLDSGVDVLGALLGGFLLRGHFI
jgi:hypothetical protein